MRPLRRGVTLIELLVTMSILAMIVLMLHSVFTVALRGWRKSDNVMQVASAARIVLERMSREISGAVVKGTSGDFFCAGFDLSGQSGWVSPSLADEFFFIAPINSGDDQISRLCEVGYWLGRDAQGRSVLKRHYAIDDRREDPADPEFDFDFSTGNDFEFAESITGLEFIFYDSNGNSYDHWDSRVSGIAPRKIKITLSVSFGKGTQATNPDLAQKDFSITVFLPN